MIDLAEIYINIQRENEAVVYLEKALKVYDDIDSKPKYYNVYKLLAMAYAGKDPEKTRYYIARYGECNDAFIKIQQELKDLEVNRAFNLEVEQFQMAREMEDWEENLDNLWRQHWALVILLAVCIISTVVFVSKYRKSDTGIKRLKTMGKGIAAGRRLKIFNRF